MQGFTLHHHRTIRGRNLVLSVTDGEWTVSQGGTGTLYAIRGPNHWRDIRGMMRRWERGLCQ